LPFPSSCRVRELVGELDDVMGAVVVVVDGAVVV
jgi:hypothetical protein